MTTASEEAWSFLNVSPSLLYFAGGSKFRPAYRYIFPTSRADSMLFEFSDGRYGASFIIPCKLAREVFYIQEVLNDASRKIIKVVSGEQ